MSYFDEKLKKHFYGNGASGLNANSNICLLDAAGEPIGCDSIDKVAAYAMCKNEFVDMGLPSGTLWAKKNLGALKETDYGDYFSWGNLNGHSEGSGYNFSEGTYEGTSGYSISADLTPAQDAAHANKGGVWRMPSKADFIELVNNTTNAWVTNYQGINGLNGRLFTATNGNTLFFPAAGAYSSATLYVLGSDGHYWSSSYTNSEQAYYLGFNDSDVFSDSAFERILGISIRPVI